MDALTPPDKRPGDFGRALREIDPQITLTSARARELRRRDYIPPAYWDAVERLAKRRGIKGIDQASMARILAGRGDGRRKKAAPEHAGAAN